MNTKDIKHTEGEWKVAANGVNQFAVVCNDRAVAFVPLFHPEGDANAYFICKAVNAYYPMLEALKEAEACLHVFSLLRKINPSAFDEMIDIKEVNKVAERALAAIKQAEQ